MNLSNLLKPVNFLLKHFVISALVVVGIFCYVVYITPLESIPTTLMSFLLGALYMCFLGGGREAYAQKNGWTIPLNKLCRDHVIEMQKYLEQPSIFKMIMHSIAVHRALVMAVRDKDVQILIREGSETLDATEAVLTLKPDEEAELL